MEADRMTGKIEHTEESIQKALSGFISSPKYVIKNLYVFGWESDLLFKTPSGYWYEIEVKITRADFLNDAKKKTGSKLKSDVLSDPNSIAPNYFYYATPKGLLSVEEIPPYAGLIEVDFSFNVEKTAPKLRGKIELNQSFLADKFYYNWKSEARKRWNAELEIQDVRRHYSDVDELVKREVDSVMNNERYRAVTAFKKACPYFNTQYYRCEKEGGVSPRCGWCDEIKSFEKEIYKESEL